MALHTRQREYAAAVQSLLESGVDVERVVQGLMRTLTQKGHRRLLPGILRALEVYEAERMRTATATLTVARDEDAARFKDEIAATAHELGASAPYDTEVDERIIGGYIFRSGTHELDASYRRSLLSLYRSITTT